MDPAALPPAPAAPPSPAPAARPTRSLAAAGPVAGTFGWLVPVFIGSLAAILCGHLARTQIRASGGAQAGYGPGNA